MPLWRWSRTAANNANADPSINWAEGQAPSSINDSARSEMAAVAAYRDDISGAIVTGGTSTAYTVTSYSAYDTLANMNGAMIAFTPHVINGATVTLNVDGLGAKPLRLSRGVEVQSNILIAGTPYTATYNHGDAAWYLRGLGGNAYGIPLAMGADYWAPITPSSAFAFPVGQNISRTAYASLFGLIGTTYGAGDGSTTFTLPNKMERVSVMKAGSATLLTSTYFGGNSTVLGATGGSESQTLTIPNLPAAPPAQPNPGFSLSTAHQMKGNAQNIPTSNPDVFMFGNDTTGVTTNNIAVTGTITIGNLGGGTAHANVQPTIVCNYIMRVA